MDDDDVCCDACGETIVICCCGGSGGSHHHHHHSGSGSGTPASLSCCCCLLATLVLAALLIAAFAFVVPVRVTVDDATLGHLTLTVPASTNATTTVSYDISLTVALHNHNWAMSLWRLGPLDAELRFRGHTLARARVASAPARRPDRIRAFKMGVYHVSAAAEGAPVVPLIGPDAAAEFARERDAGRGFELQLAVFVEVQYEAHPRRRSVSVTCPLRLSPSTTTAPAAFSRVKCA